MVAVRNSKKLLAIATMLFLLFSSGTLASSHAEADDSSNADAPHVPQYEPCRKQIERYVHDTFQQTVTEIEFDFVFDYRTMGRGGDGPKSAAIVYTRECPGYHVFDLFATDYDCESRAHYGSVPNYIRYRVSERGC